VTAGRARVGVGGAELPEPFVRERVAGTGLEVAFEFQRALSFVEGEVGDEPPRAVLGRVDGLTDVVGFQASLQVFGESNVSLVGTRFALD